MEHPFGEDYFLFRRTFSQYGRGEDWYGDTVNFRFYEVNQDNYAKDKLHLKKADSTIEYWMTIINDYDTKSYGVFNMESGVKEWLLNTSEMPNANWLEAYTKSVYPKLQRSIIDSALQTKYFKDSTGKMPYRIMAHNKDGLPIIISAESNTDSVYKRLIISGEWKNPSAQVDSLQQNVYREGVGFRCVLPYRGNKLSKKNPSQMVISL